MNLAVIARILEHKYPELAAGWHLPMWAEVVAIGEPLAQQTVTEEEPIYAVDLQLLKPDGSADDDVPVFEQVPLPSLAGGQTGRGVWSKPEPGTWVELAFAYGSPAHPFIRQVLPHGREIPKMHERAQRWQQNHQSFQQVDEQGAWRRETDHDITDQGLNYTADITADHTVNAKNSYSNIEENLTELIGRARKAVAKTHYAGNDSDNIYALLLEFMQLMLQQTQLTAAHGHPYFWTDNGGAAVTSAPLQAINYMQQGDKLTDLVTRLTPMIP